MLSPSRWRFTSQRFDKPQASVDKHKDKNTAAFVPLLCRILMQICEIIVASDVWMRRTITLQNNTIHHGRGTFIMAFESLQFLAIRAISPGMAARLRGKPLGPQIPASEVRVLTLPPSWRKRGDDTRKRRHFVTPEPTPAEFPLFIKLYLRGRPET